MKTRNQPETRNPKPETDVNISLTSHIPSMLKYIALLSLLLTVGCSPSLAPMFKDFEFVKEQDDDLQDRITMALEDVGWELAEDAILPSVIMTQERTLNRRGIYKTTAVLEILPVGDDYVRVLIHPYRDHLIGSRSKLPYLPGNIERQIVPDIVASFQLYGLHAPGKVPSDSLTAE